MSRVTISFIAMNNCSIFLGGKKINNNIITQEWSSYYNFIYQSLFFFGVYVSCINCINIDDCIFTYMN